ncbi:MAG: V-type ATP synthase subunit I [Candidatus Norongarragalinales archaeon]
MGKVKFKKLVLVSTERHREVVMRSLQELGVVHIQPSEEPKPLSEEREAHLRQLLSHLNHCISFYRRFAPFKRDPIEMFAELDRRTPLSEEKKCVFREEVLANLPKIYEECQKEDAKLCEFANREQALADLKEKLKPFAQWQVDSASTRGTRETSAGLYEFKKKDFASFVKLAKHSAATVVWEKKASVIALVVSLKGFEGEASEFNAVATALPDALASFGFEGSPAEVLARVEEERASLAAARKEFEAQEKEKALSLLPKLEAAFDSVLSDERRLHASRHLFISRHSFALTAWVPARDAARVEDAVKRACGGECAIVFEEPDAAKGDNPPLLLKNNALFKPFEGITLGFGIPSYFESDPTPFLAPFFFLFTGLCLTDAGYGVVLVVASALLWKRYKQLRGFFALLVLIGISTIVCGALIGGWFGGLVPLPLLWFDSMKNPVSFLILSFVLGFVHLVWGLVAEFYDALRSRDFVHAFADVFLWISLLLSVFAFALVAMGIAPKSLESVITYWVGGSALGLVLTQGRHKKNPAMKLFSGIVSLYGLVGYFSDVMSYSRLLALGLSTGVVAMIVNELAKIGLNMGFGPFGLVVAAGILIIGHAFNLVLNLLGAYIHSMRLQYVEFFSKFLSGGGVRYEPLRLGNVYTKPLPSGVFVKSED